jgi:hypothetical protein
MDFLRDGTGLEVVLALKCRPAAHLNIDVKVITLAGWTVRIQLSLKARWSVKYVLVTVATVVTFQKASRLLIAACILSTSLALPLDVVPDIVQQTIERFKINVMTN